MWNLVVCVFLFLCSRSKECQTIFFPFCLCLLLTGSSIAMRWRMLGRGTLRKRSRPTGIFGGCSSRTRTARRGSSTGKLRRFQRGIRKRFGFLHRIIAILWFYPMYNQGLWIASQTSVSGNVGWQSLHEFRSWHSCSSARRWRSRVPGFSAYLTESVGES